MKRRIPVEAELLTEPGLGLDVADLVRSAVRTPDVAALTLAVDVIGIYWIGKRPEAVTTKEGFPTAVRDAPWISGIADKHSVVLETSIYPVGIGVVGAD